ncbi:MAG: hypothetical protein IJK14_08745 [Clostridia bacterium]|nr:hypothetical protein [Clostridia bacterium]
MKNIWTFQEYDPEIPFSSRDHGTCMCCGKEDRDLIILNDDERICLQCLDADFAKCDGCGEYWPSDMVSQFGSEMICDFCLEEMEDEEAEEDEEFWDDF